MTELEILRGKLGAREALHSAEVRERDARIAALQTDISRLRDAEAGRKAALDHLGAPDLNRADARQEVQASHAQMVADLNASWRNQS